MPPTLSLCTSENLRTLYVPNHLIMPYNLVDGDPIETFLSSFCNVRCNIDDTTEIFSLLKPFMQIEIVIEVSLNSIEKTYFFQPDYDSS